MSVRFTSPVILSSFDERAESCGARFIAIAQGPDTDQQINRTCIAVPVARPGRRWMKRR